MKDGIDGLGGVHTSVSPIHPFPPLSPFSTPIQTDQSLNSHYHQHPHFTPSDTWSHLFFPPTNDPITTTAATSTHSTLPNSSHAFTPSPLPAVDQILSLLSLHPPDTLTLIALGPLTNFALAAARSPTVFLRARAVCIMGGTLALPGNITPVGEFNTLADPLAAARVYALTSPNPASTMPPPSSDVLPPYPPAEQLSARRLKAIMFPLDVTTGQKLREAGILDVCTPLMERGSPLAGWVNAFTRSTFEKERGLHVAGESEMSLHDVVVVWDAVTGGMERGRGWRYDGNLDVRIETLGQWTAGMCVVDRRGRKLLEERDDAMGAGMEEKSEDQGGWLSRHRGNRVDVCVGTPGGEGGCADALLGRVFGV